MEFLSRIEKLLSLILICIAGLFLVAMVVLTCADILLRLFWVPIRGSVELVALFGSVTTAFALGYTQMRKGHIAVDVVVGLLPGCVKKWLIVVNSAVCSSFFVLVSWRIAVWSTTIRDSGELTETLRIVFYPFSYAVSLGCAFLALVFVMEFLGSVLPKKGGTV